jgi:diphthine synthase
MAAAPPSAGLLYIIGLGLGDHRDVTHRGSAAIASCDVVFLEAYTSVLCVDAAALEAAFGKRIELAHRETVESESELILGPARQGRTVGFLVVGDPFGATTHTDLLLRARAAGITTKIVHNASIMNAVGACGLQLYSFGQTVSIPFFRDAWQPDSFYDRIAHNASGGLHTLCLLGALHCCCSFGCWLLISSPSWPRSQRAPHAHHTQHALCCWQTSRCASPTLSCWRARAKGSSCRRAS